jgi:serine/threonine protein kinase
MIIDNKYKIITKLKSGVFGSVFKCENIRTGEFVAIKFEDKNNEMKTIKNEAKIYQYLGNIDGFPHLKWFGTNEQFNYLAINLLGSSLSEMITYYKAFSLKTVLLIGIQLIRRIQTLHDKSILHRDIKPDNFLFGLGTDTNKLYLIDFGFAKRYEYNGKHIEEKHINNIIGSQNFVSLNVHNGIEPSRRDDIESCIYIILNMLLGNLEWFDTNIDKYKIPLLKKQILLLNEVPSFIKIMLCYVRAIKFNETPDYEYLVILMTKIFYDNNYKNDGQFEWV